VAPPLRAASRAKEPTKALVALRKGRDWLADVAKEVAVKMGSECVLKPSG
jgi:hypothetical protein